RLCYSLMTPLTSTLFPYTTLFRSRRYDNQNADVGLPRWTAAEYMQGFVGDVGSLAKLVMIHNGVREGEATTERLAHELADCLWRSEEHTSELQSRENLVCRLLLEK